MEKMPVGADGKVAPSVAGAEYETTRTAVSVSNGG